jgi:hypothetical protein
MEARLQPLLPQILSSYIELGGLDINMDKLEAATTLTDLELSPEDEEELMQ